nr:PIN domain-containing protein [Metallosphaera hakonensis]
MDDLNCVDANVIISLVEQDVNFEKAKKLKGRKGLVTGEITHLELDSFFSRKLKDERKARASTLYSLQLSEVRVIELDSNRLITRPL